MFLWVFVGLENVNLMKFVNLILYNILMVELLKCDKKIFPIPIQVFLRRLPLHPNPKMLATPLFHSFF